MVFGGKNGYRSFDLILGDKEIYGYIHCESDVISLINKFDYGMDVDINKDKMIRLFNSYGFKFSSLGLSNITITSNKDEIFNHIPRLDQGVK